jgi:spore germination cell wall hydrolase CwlJ-like protein
MKRIAPLALLALSAFVEPLAASTPSTSLILSGVPVVIDGDTLAKEQRCLAEAVYFEARSEEQDGRAAVAQVVLNRVRSGVYPGSVCGVVYQNRHRYLACQFTFACEGKSLRITEPEPWREAVRIARDVYEGRIYLAEVGASTHYHADYVSPYWAKKLKKMDVIGRHIFYSDETHPKAAMGG